MNQVFDFKRFTLLTGKHWSENRKKYFLSLVAMAGLLLLWFSFSIIVEYYNALGEDMQVITYYTGLYLVGCLYASMLFSDLSTVPKAINYLSVPGSALEKLLVNLLYGLVLFFVSYTIIFYLIDIPMVQVANKIAYGHWVETHAAGETYVPEKIVNVFVKAKDAGNYDLNPYAFLIMIYVAVQSAYILGSIYFPVYSAVKTTVALMVLIGIVFLFTVLVLNLFIPRGAEFRNFTSYYVEGKGAVIKYVQIPGWIDAILVFLFKFAWAPIFWIVTYFRLKEKEV
jgi:hypothetical protein